MCFLKKGVVYSANFLASLFQKRSYHPGYTASRPISEVKQDRAFSSTQVGDHCETKGGVSFCCRSSFCCTTTRSPLAFLPLHPTANVPAKLTGAQLFFPGTIFFSRTELGDFFHFHFHFVLKTLRQARPSLLCSSNGECRNTCRILREINACTTLFQIESVLERCSRGARECARGPFFHHPSTAGPTAHSSSR